MQYEIREKNNLLARHMICDTIERAEYHLRETIPVYVARGYYMDKNLTAADFVIVEVK